MEASGERKGEDEALMRRLNIVYFLNRKGKIEQPHLIKVHHPDNNGVYLRDFKSCLSKLMGREMLESFSWSCKRTYKNDYIWEDLAEDDLIIPISNREYVLMGSLLFSPNKIIKKLKEEEEPKLFPTNTALKLSFKTFQIKNNTSPKLVAKVDKEPAIETLASTSASNSEKEIIPKLNEQQFKGASSNSEKAKKKTVTFKIDSPSEDMKRIKRHENENFVPKENGRQSNGVKIKESNGDEARKWISVLKKFMGCTMVKNVSIMKSMSNQSDGSSISNNINEEKVEDKKNQKRKEGRRKSLFFCMH